MDIESKKSVALTSTDKFLLRRCLGITKCDAELDYQ